MVHLDGVPYDAPYWVIALGPLYQNLYDWAVVSDNFSISLFILARDYNRFDTLYKDEVLALVEKMGFKPVDLYQGDDCVYASTTRAKEIKMSMLKALNH
jgi:lipocalin